MPHDPHPAFPIPPTKVLKVVAKAYGLTVADLTSRDQRNPRPAARRVACRLLHEESWLSWASVSEVLKRRVKGATVASRSVLADPDALAELRDRLRNGHGNK